MDTFFALIIIGAADAGLRRGLIKPSLLAPSQSAVVKRNFGNYGGYWLPLVLLLLVPLTGLLLEGARINAAQPKFTEWAYLGRNTARIEGAFGAGMTFHRWLWLVHVLLVYALLFCLPFTKLRHFLIAPVNLFFRNLGQRGRLTPIEDFESAETFGVSQIEQYTWNQLGGTQIYDRKGMGYQLDQTGRSQFIAGTKAIQALSRADGRWYFLPVVELPVILTPGEDGYIVAECPRRPDFSVFPITW